MGETIRAAVTPLLVQEGGQKLAVGILPMYVCRWPAYVENSSKISFSETTKLEESVQFLISNLNPQQSMVNLSRREFTLRTKR